MKLKIIIKGPECLYNYNVISPHPYKIFYILYIYYTSNVVIYKRVSEDAPIFLK